MSALAQKNKWTVDDYYRLEEESDLKHEYYFGDVVAMAGTSEDHILITGNIFASLHQQLRKRPCRVYQSEMRIYVSDDEQFYPDVVALCSEPVFHENRRDTITNPQVIFEVLSPSTANFDRSAKFVSYRQLPSLEHYVLVSQDKLMIEYYRRQEDDTWLLTVIENDTQAISLDLIACKLEIDDIYEKITLK